MIEGVLQQLLLILIEIIYRGKDIFLAPIVNFDMLWILMPIYINWILADFLSTKADFSTAAITGFTYLWVGTNWLREYFRNIQVDISTVTNGLTTYLQKIFSVANTIELFIVFAMFIYGLVTMSLAVRGKSISKFLGDVRTEAYLMIVATPLLFRAVAFDIITINAILFYGIFFYLGTEVIYLNLHPKE